MQTTTSCMDKDVEEGNGQGRNKEMDNKGWDEDYSKR